MSVECGYVHYINLNVEGRLPHQLVFGPLYGRLVTDEDVSGQVITIVSFGFPRRYYVWSTFEANLRVNEFKGKTVVQGDGWHLCPPMEIPEENVNYLVNGNLREHQFVKVTDPATFQWLQAVANHYQPPGNPDRLRAFLKKMYRTVGNEEIERKIQKVWRTIKG